MPVALGVHPDRGHAETEETRVEAGQLRFDIGVVEEIVAHDLGELGIMPAAGAAADAQDLRDRAIAQAFAQHALPDHA